MEPDVWKAWMGKEQESPEEPYLPESPFDQFMPADKTAVGKPSMKKPLYWEKPRNETRLPKYVPFESLLQKEAIRRQKESEPQSGHVEPQFFPAMGVLKGVKQTGNLAKEDFKNLIKGRLKQ